MTKPQPPQRRLVVTACQGNIGVTVRCYDGRWRCEWVNGFAKWIHVAPDPGVYQQRDNDDYPERMITL